MPTATPERTARAERTVASLTLRFDRLLIAVDVLTPAVTTSLPASPVVITDGSPEPVALAAITASGGVVDPRAVVGAVSVADNPRYLTREVLDAALGQTQHVPIRYFVSRACAERTYTVVQRFLLRQQTLRGTRRAANDLALGVLLRALRDEGAVAIIIANLGGTPRFAMIDGDGWLSTLHFDHERADMPLPADPDDDDLALRARMLVMQSMTSIPMPLVDTVGAVVRDYLAAPVEAPGDAPAEAPAEATLRLPRNVEDVRSAVLPPAVEETASAARRRRPRVTIGDATAPADGLVMNDPWATLTVPVASTPTITFDASSAANTNYITVDMLSETWQTLRNNYTGASTYTMTVA
jgi:hypothetical protein